MYRQYYGFSNWSRREYIWKIELYKDLLAPLEFKKKKSLATPGKAKTAPCASQMKIREEIGNAS
jgi:hypothetical protein